MQCESTRKFFLDNDTFNGNQQCLGAAVEHLTSCEACKDALADYKQIRDILQAGSCDAAPTKGWENFNRRIMAAISSD